MSMSGVLKKMLAKFLFELGNWCLKNFSTKSSALTRTICEMLIKIFCVELKNKCEIKLHKKCMEILAICCHLAS